MSRGAAIALRGVSARYPNAARLAVRDVSIDIAPGEIVALVGPSGSGKSTLLRTINRLVPLESGDVGIDGASISTLDDVALRRRIGYVIQAVGLFPHMTVAANVAVVPELLRWDRERTRARVDELLALVRLDPDRYRSRKPHQLSGGEAQRVGVARAIAAEPHALLMDEPFGALDAIVRKDLQAELRSIVDTLGTTTIIVTHDVDEALSLANRIAVIRDGEMQQIATPLELLARPANDYVASLVRSNDTIRRLRLLRAGDGTMYDALDALLDGRPSAVSFDEIRAAARR